MNASRCSDTANQRPRSGAKFGFVYISALMSAISFGIVIPILPNLIREMTGGDIAEAAEWAALFAAVWGFAQFICAPLLGAMSDRFGRRPVLLVSTFGLGVDYLVMAVAPSLPLLLIGRFMSGATASSLSTAHAYVADIVTQENRAAAFGRLASSISVGYLIGPALGGWLGEFDLRLPYVAAALMTLANWLYGFFVLPESLEPHARSPQLAWRAPISKSGLGALFARPEIARLAGISVLNSLSNMIWGSVWVLFCAYRFGWSPMAMGVAILASGIAGVGVQWWGVGRIVKSVGERNTLLIGAAVGATTLTFTAFAPNGWWYVASIPVAAFGLLFGPGLQGLISANVGPDEQGRVRGGMQGLSGLSTVVAPPVYGALFAWSVRHSTTVDLSGAALLLSAGCLAAAFLLGVQIPRDRKRAEEPHPI